MEVLNVAVINSIGEVESLDSFIINPDWDEHGKKVEMAKNLFMDRIEAVYGIKDEELTDEDRKYFLDSWIYEDEKEGFNIMLFWSDNVK